MLHDTLGRGVGIGRGERVRTSGLRVPNAALYQAELCPEKLAWQRCSGLGRPPRSTRLSYAPKKWPSAVLERSLTYRRQRAVGPCTEPRVQPRSEAPPKRSSELNFWTVPGSSRRAQGTCDLTGVRSMFDPGRFGWWTVRGSNRRPPACHAGGRPSELTALKTSSSGRDASLCKSVHRSALSHLS